jgi:hypothetical protein
VFGTRGRVSPYPCTAAILWASAWWALTANISSKPTPIRGAA